MDDVGSQHARSTLEDVGRLRDAVRVGGLALVPTDTVYGLACALDSPEGVDALYALKGRPRSQASQVLLFAPRLLDEAASPLDARTAAAVRALLPGPVTCIVPDPAGRYAAAAGDAPGGVGLRAPRMSGPLGTFDLPLVATSANDPGGPDPATLDDVPRAIRTGVAVEIDAGPLTPVSSAVVDLRGVGEGRSAALLRPGADPGTVRRALADVGVDLGQ